MSNKALELYEASLKNQNESYRSIYERHLKEIIKKCELDSQHYFERSFKYSITDLNNNTFNALVEELKNMGFDVVCSMDQNKDYFIQISYDFASKDNRKRALPHVKLVLEIDSWTHFDCVFIPVIWGVMGYFAFTMLFKIAIGNWFWIAFLVLNFIGYFIAIIGFRFKIHKVYLKEGKVKNYDGKERKK
jgi:hypothetical protein